MGAINFTTSNSKDEPYNNFVYQVEIDNTTVGGFTKVAGLSVESEVLEYQEGGLHDVTHTFPTKVTFPNVKLHRGETAHDNFIEWITKSVMEPAKEVRFDVDITMKDIEQSATWGWKLIDAYPVRWEGPQMVANADRFAMELLELSYQEFDYIKY